MCGICGVAAAGPTPERAAVVRGMMDRLRHRGPDGEGLVDGESWIFGHTRLSIIDIEHGAQPMRTPDGRFTLVYNGEIYNYLELRSDLQMQGIEFRTTSDTEVLLQILALEGEDALGRLNGMFAFAIHDAETGEIVLARDPFGVKPLYYALTARGELVFASEIKAILAHPEVEARTDRQALQEYLTFQFCLGNRTLFDGIKKIEPGCMLRWSPRGTVRTRRYWDCDFRVDENHTESYFASRLSELMTDSVRLQLRSDVPLGAHLSGGLDSSVVAALAARAAGSRISVFHGRFAEGTEYDESAYARTVAQAIGADFWDVVPTAEDFVEDLPRLIYFMDEPAAGPGLFPQHHVSRLAARNVKVVLGGQGGDEIFAGYARYLLGYLEQALKGAVYETQEEGKYLVTLDSIVPNLALLREYVPLMRYFWSDGLFEAMDARYFRLVDRSPDMATLLDRDFLDTWNGDAVFEAFRREFNHPDTQSYVNKMTHFDIKTLLPALLQVEDRVSMAVSLESRVPLLDTRIVDLVTTMPPALKFTGGKTKYALKRAAADLLPSTVVERKDKMGFPVPLSEWMRGGPVREFVGDVLLGTTARQRGIFRTEELEQLIATEAPFGRQIWGALCLELWHQAFGAT